MTDRKYSFLKAVIGESGAQALHKAAVRSEPLGNALVPRAIFSWLAVASRFDYEGELPGVSNTYLNFKKSEAGYNGSVAIGDEVYKFQDASIFHLAASVAVALDVNLQPTSDSLKDGDIVKLGKSIDALVKARVLTDELLAKKPQTKKTELPGQAATALAPEVPAAPTATAPKPSKGKLPHPSKKKPILQGTAPAATVGITKSELLCRCKLCGMHLFKSEKFTGCFCFRELAPGVQVLAKGEDYTLQFDSRWDDEAVQTLVESLGRK